MTEARDIAIKSLTIANKCLNLRKQASRKKC
jgi:hypothetical protein